MGVGVDEGGNNDVSIAKSSIDRRAGLGVCRIDVAELG
jgi:hypothetical protein